MKEKCIDEMATHQWSLDGVLWKAYTGSYLFRGKSLEQLLKPPNRREFPFKKIFTYTIDNFKEASTY